jgi:hypothetical protein
MCNNETDFSVLQEMIRSLGDIGIREQDNANVIRAIIRIIHSRLNLRHQDNPSDLLALYAVNALDMIAKNNNGIQSELLAEVLENLSRISNGNFSNRVKDRTRQVREDILRMDVQRRFSS